MHALKWWRATSETLFSDPTEPTWDGYNHIICGETAQDAMRALILDIKKNDSEEKEWAIKSGYEHEPTEIPKRVWAVPMNMDRGTIHQTNGDRYDEADTFNSMWDWEKVEEVRL